MWCRHMKYIKQKVDKAVEDPFGVAYLLYKFHKPPPVPTRMVIQIVVAYLTRWGNGLTRCYNR